MIPELVHAHGCVGSGVGLAMWCAYFCFEYWQRDDIMYNTAMYLSVVKLKVWLAASHGVSRFGELALASIYRRKFVGGGQTKISCD